jgi:hypothetical protein
MNKIGYLFICASALKQPNIWLEYFKKSSEHQILYLFYKSQPDMRGFNNIKYIDVSEQKPGWGNSNYIACIIDGLKVLYTEFNVDSVLVFSESCIPIHNIRYIHNIINATSKSLIDIHKIGKKDKCFDRMKSAQSKSFFMNRDYLYKYSAQGLCIKRKLGEILIKTKDKYLKDFKWVRNIDEHYIPAVLELEKLNIYDYINYRKMSYFNWKIYGFNNKIPYTFLCLDMCIITYIGKDYLFLRKVHENTNIHCDIFALADKDYKNSVSVDLNSYGRVQIQHNFNWKIYKKLNKDFIEKELDTEESAMEHWKKYGFKKHKQYSVRHITIDFDWKRYKELNPDLKFDSWIDYELHWVKYGKKENRKY